MKKIALFIVLAVLFAGCQSQPQRADTTGSATQIILPTPSSKGPDGPPSVKGPTIPLPGQENQDVQAVTETETVRYTLPGVTSEFKQ